MLLIEMYLQFIFHFHCCSCVSLHFKATEQKYDEEDKEYNLAIWFSVTD
jgi:hypothetical protein